MSPQNNLRLAIISGEEAVGLIARFSDASWRQFPSYARAAAKQNGAISEYAVVYDGDELIGMANVRLKGLPVFSGGIAFISHGPMVVGTGSKFCDDRYNQVLNILSEHYRGLRGYCLRVENSLQTFLQAEQTESRHLASGFEPIPRQQYQTFLLDLSKGTEALRKELNGKWRTDLRRGERGDLRVTRSTRREDFGLFSPLLEKLAAQKGFSAPQDTAFFRDVAERAEAGERIEIHLAYAGDELVAGHIGAFSGDMAVYLLGAANGKGRDLRAAYVLQWAVINRAIELGMNYYDLGGADQAENPSVFRFKKRMGGKLVVNRPKFQSWPDEPKKTIIALAEWGYGLLKGKR